jgi:hypothetical protein
MKGSTRSFLRWGALIFELLSLYVLYLTAFLAKVPITRDCP